MKNLTLLLIFVSTITLSAQTWTYKSGGNAFDGKYRTASIIGKGTDYPYHKPLLVINLFNEESLNFYISGAGYFSSTYDLEILWSFSNDPNTIYYSDDFSISEDGKTIFLSSFVNQTTSEKVYQIEYFEKLKNAGKVDVRIKNKYGKNDISFSLSGSTKAINYVVSKNYLNKRKALLEEYRKKLLVEIDKKIKKDSIVLNLLVEKGVREEEKNSVLDRINEYFQLYDLNTKDIDSLSFDVSTLSADIKLFDKKNSLIKKIKYIDNKMPDTFRDFKAKIEEKKKQEIANQKAKIESSLKRISKLLDVYEFTDEEKSPILDRVQKSFESESFRIRNNLTINDIEEIDSIQVYRDYVHSWDNANFLSKNNGKMFSLTFYSGLSDRVMSKIEEKQKAEMFMEFKDHISKYFFTEEEILDIFDSASSVLKIYYNYDLSSVSNIELYLPDRFAKYINIRIYETNGTKKERSLNSLDKFRIIVKKIKKYNDQ